MNAQSPPHVSPDNAALRAAFRAADRKTRPGIIAQVPAQEVEFAGVRMFVHPGDNYTEQRLWLDQQPPEMDSLMALVELVEDKSALVLDVGANCGAFTVPLAMAVGADSRVVAFEPNPVMVERLQHNLALNDVADVVQIETCALGAERGEAVLHLKRGNYGQASLRPVRAAQRAGENAVAMASLLDFVDADARYDITVLKIDVEGGEDAALSPMLEAGTWSPDVILMETRHGDAWEGDLLGRLHETGFRAAREMDGNTLFVKGTAA